MSSAAVKVKPAVGMRCGMDVGELANALKAVERAVSRRGTALPVLQNVLLEAEGDRLRLSATDLDLTVRTDVAASVEQAGATTIPAGLLTECVGQMGTARCEITVDPRTSVAEVGIGGRRTRIHGIEAAEYPPLPGMVVGEGATVELVGSVFREAVAQVSAAASTDDQMPVLTGALLVLEPGGRLTLVCTDRHRLVVRRVVGTNATGQETRSVVVPARHLREAAKCSVASQMVRVAICEDERHVQFQVGPCTVVTARVIEGQFPKFEQVIPAEEAVETAVDVGGRELVAELRRAAVVAGGAAGRPVSLRTGDGCVEVRGEQAEIGEYEGSVEATVQGTESSVAVNVQYLVEAAEAVGARPVRLGLSGSLKPVLVRPVETRDLLCVIMPIRLP
jgi:DNA polymerase-3 subunit beta